MSGYCANPFSYQRRVSREVKVGRVGIGGENPIRVQSMITCDTMDTEASIAQTMELAGAGCEIVRITAPTVKDAANLQHIVRGLRERGCNVPIVADIHFKPEAAMEAAKWVDKVRINPGNYADTKKFKIVEYTDEQYAAELDRIRQRFTPLVRLCKERGIAMRIGTNHGSLSDRIMNRYGDTPLGMVESALEFARIARDLDYHAFVFSMKSSNPKVMIAAYRLLVARLAEVGVDDARRATGGSSQGPGRLGSIAPTAPAQQVDKSDIEDVRNGRGGSRELPAQVEVNSRKLSESIAPTWNYPIHLGVTEAGEGEDARIKSAIGIGSLLADGIGDTIRVSLTEDSIHEIPVAKALIDCAMRIADRGSEKPEIGSQKSSFVAAVANRGHRSATETTATTAISFDPFSYQRRPSDTIRVAAVSDRRDQASDGQRPLQIKLGGAELVRVVIRKEQHEKIAHKIDRIGDYRPEIIYENANIVEIDPCDDDAIARVNRSPGPQFVTVKDEVELPMISAFRLLAAKLQPRHPILLKDVLGSAAVSAAVSCVSRETGTALRRESEEKTRGPSPAGIACATQDFLDTLLVASTNIGSLLCDGIGDAISATELQHFASGRCPDFQDRLRRVSKLRSDLI